MVDPRKALQALPSAGSAEMQKNSDLTRVKLCAGMNRFGSSGILDCGCFLHPVAGLMPRRMEAFTRICVSTLLLPRASHADSDLLSRIRPNRRFRQSTVALPTHCGAGTTVDDGSLRPRRALDDCTPAPAAPGRKCPRHHMPPCISCTPCRELHPVHPAPDNPAPTAWARCRLPAAGDHRSCRPGRRAVAVSRTPRTCGSSRRQSTEASRTPGTCTRPHACIRHRPAIGTGLVLSELGSFQIPVVVIVIKGPSF